MAELKLHTLIYTKADLDAAPADERLFYLMATGVANDVQALSKTFAITLRTVEHEHRITNQGNSAYAFLILRMLAGRLNEAWNLTSKFSPKIKQRYLDDLSEEARNGFRTILRYFGKQRPLIRKVRDGVAFHQLPQHVEEAYGTLDPDTDIGDYLCEKIGNTLFYTTEILQYETLKNLAGAPDFGTAIMQLVNDANKLTIAFNSFIYGFSVVFFQRHLAHSLDRLRDEYDVFDVPDLETLSLPYFSRLPTNDDQG